MQITTYANDISVTNRIVAIDCPNCGTTFGIGNTFYEKRQADHRSFYCPNGHSQYFPQQSEAEKLQQRLDWAVTSKRALRDQLDATERSRRSYKGQVTRIKRRVGAGVCPCCNRTFQDLARHMEGQHPGFSSGPQDSSGG